MKGNKMVNKTIELANELLAHKEKWPLFNLPEHKVLQLAQMVIEQETESKEDAYYRLSVINLLLCEGFDNQSYDLQAVNQAHRISAGGMLPKETTLEKERMTALEEALLDVLNSDDEHVLKEHILGHDLFFRLKKLLA